MILMVVEVLEVKIIRFDKQLCTELKLKYYILIYYSVLHNT